MLEDGSHVVHLAQLLQEWNIIVEAAVVHVIVPGDDRQGVVRLEEVRCRRVVDNQDVPEITSHFREILDIEALIVGAMVAEKASGAASLLVQDVHQWIGILRKACSVYDKLVVW